MSIVNENLKSITLKSMDGHKDITLSALIQDKEAIKGLIDSMNQNEFSSFKTSSHLPFLYQAYQKNRYLPLVWLNDKDIQVGIDKDIERNAKKFLGRRYVWGAVGPNCFDCSGFTMKVFREAGINLPRVSRNQAKVGKLVKFNELKRGDMVFFDTSRKHAGRVNHVGIYLEDGKFIHASSGKKRVVITSFDKKAFYKQRFLWGRRVVESGVNYAFDALPTLPTLASGSSFGKSMGLVSL